ncbi:MAG: hypothetical protein AAF235_10985, partial [Planctomycetota bacterium]
MKSVVESIDGVRRVASSYAVLFARSTVGRRRTLAVSVAFAVIGGIGQGAMAPLVGYAVHSIQAASTAGSSLVPAVAIWGVALLAVTGLGAWAAFESARWARRVARGLHVHQIDEIIGAVSRSDSVMNTGMPVKRGDLNRLALRDPMQASSAIEMLIVLVEPLARVVFSVLVLVWVGGVLSLVLLPAFLVLGPLLYKLVWRIGRDSRAFYEEHVVRMWGAVAGQVARADAMRLGDDRDEPARLLMNPEIASFLDENDRMQLANSRVQFASGVLFSFLLAAALMLCGWLAVTGRLEWGPTLAFLLALLTVVRGMRVVVNVLSQLGKFYPAVKRLNAFAVGASPSSQRGVSWPIELTDDGRTLRLEPGVRVGLVTDAAVSRSGLRLLLRPIAPSGNVRLLSGSVALIGKPFEPDVAAARDTVRAVGEARSLALLERMGVLAEYNALCGESAGASARQAPGGTLRLAIACLALSVSKAQIAVIALPVLNAADAASAEEALAVLDTKLVVVAGAAFTMPAFCGDTLLVARGGERLGFGNRAWA